MPCSEDFSARLLLLSCAKDTRAIGEGSEAEGAASVGATLRGGGLEAVVDAGALKSLSVGGVPCCHVACEEKVSD